MREEGSLVFSLGFLLGAFVVILIVVCVAAMETKVDHMKEAFDRGYAVQCMGVEGYHWECPTVKGENDK